MLILGHVGYTVGGGWAAQRLRLKNPVDFRLLALMALLPDIIDRALYLFIITDAYGSRLIAHTLAFQLALFVVLILFRRDFWIYGLASLAHLALDAPLPAAQMFWPLLGAGLENVQIGDGLAAAAGQSFWPRVLDRLEENLRNYSDPHLRPVLFELGGLAVLLAFALRARLYQRRRLVTLARRGRVGAGG